MVSMSSRDWIESRLRLELEAAKGRLDNASPSEHPEAREHYKAALRRFAVFVLYGVAPAAWIGQGW